MRSDFISEAEGHQMAHQWPNSKLYKFPSANIAHCRRLAQELRVGKGGQVDCRRRYFISSILLVGVYICVCVCVFLSNTKNCSSIWYWSSNTLLLHRSSLHHPSYRLLVISICGVVVHAHYSVSFCLVQTICLSLP